ncbi:MAG: hypothetical protein NT079_03340, partial [Candidatus Omnitrophica bacterium]|nr:hypothetical protein [Candidatus Omnitrophota bacterium]
MPRHAPGEILVMYQAVNESGDGLRGSEILTEHAKIANAIAQKANLALNVHKPLSSSTVQKMVNANNTEKEVLKEIINKRKAQKRSLPSDQVALSKANSSSRMLLLRFQDNQCDVLKIAQQLNNSTLIVDGKTYNLIAEPNYLYQTSSAPNDALYSQQWAHQNTEAEAGWTFTTGSPNIKIAVIDTGVAT